MLMLSIGLVIGIIGTAVVMNQLHTKKLADAEKAAQQKIDDLNGQLKTAAQKLAGKI